MTALIPQILNKIDDLAKDISDLKVQGARVEERLRPIPQMDKRLQAVEQSVLTIKVITKSILALIAIVGAIMGIVRFLLPLFD